MPGLTIRKLADTNAPRFKRYDPETGEPYLVDASGQRSPRPFLGIQIDEPHDEVRISDTVVNNGVAEGWITLDNPQPVVRPAGATMDVWVSTHTGTPHFFTHADKVTFHTTDGDLVYKVTHQPDKYHADGDKKKVTVDAYEAGETRVDHFYDLVKES